MKTGFSLSRGISNHWNYIHDLYFGIFDNILEPNTFTLRIVVTIDVWIRSFLVRSNMFVQVISFCVLCCEMGKRLEAFNSILSHELIKKSPRTAMLRNFADSYRLIGKSVAALDGKLQLGLNTFIVNN